MLTKYMDQGVSSFALVKQAFANPQRIKLDKQAESRLVTRQEFEARKLQEGESVHYIASPLHEILPADVIATQDLMSADVLLGTTVLYLYKPTGKVRRVFKIIEPQVKELLQAKKWRYYLPDLEWGKVDSDLSAAKLQTALDIERLLRTCVTKGAANGKKQVPTVEPTKASQSVEVPPPRVAPTTAPAKPASPADIENLRSSVERKVTGEATVGVVAEMGNTIRSNSGRTFTSYCIKVDVHGVLHPLYGVELEREARERNVKAGDTVRVTKMGTQVTPNGHKNLFRIEVLKRA